MPLNWHVNLPGPVAYSRPIRKSRKKSGPLTAMVVWFIVKPLEWTVRGTVALFRGLGRPHTVQRSVAPVSFPEGWYHTPYGPLWWNGAHWIRPDGRVHM